MLKMSDWWCTNCNFKIFGSKSQCGKCGMSRSQSVLHSQTSTEYKKHINDVSEQIFELKDKLTDGEFKGILDSLKGCYDQAPANSSVNSSVNSNSSINNRRDWYCNNCNFTIFASKDSCKKCGAKRPN